MQQLSVSIRVRCLSALLSFGFLFGVLPLNKNKRRTRHQYIGLVCEAVFAYLHIGVDRLLLISVGCRLKLWLTPPLPFSIWRLPPSTRQFDWWEQRRYPPNKGGYRRGMLPMQAVSAMGCRRFPPVFSLFTAKTQSPHRVRTRISPLSWRCTKAAHSAGMHSAASKPTPRGGMFGFGGRSVRLFVWIWREVRLDLEGGRQEHILRF